MNIVGNSGLILQVCLFLQTTAAVTSESHTSRSTQHQHINYVCGDYRNAISIELPEGFDEDGLLFDFIQADVSCSYHEAEQPANTDGSTFASFDGTEVRAFEFLVNSSDIPTKFPLAPSKHSRKRQVPPTFQVPSQIHFHLYAVPSELELRYRCDPPQFVVPVMGPLLPPLVPTATVWNGHDMAQSTATDDDTENYVGAEAAPAPNGKDRDPSSLSFQRGLSFVYNASVPANTTHATVELWIPTPYFQRMTVERLAQEEQVTTISKQTILLGPRFDHSWSVDLTMNPSTSLGFDAAKSLLNISNSHPPMDVTIFSDGAGTSLTLNYTAPSTSLDLVDETLHGLLHVQQNLWDPNADMDATTADLRQISDDGASTSHIVTLGSNTLATIVRGVYDDNYTAPDDVDDFQTIIALDGFQQKVTIAGIGDNTEKDFMEVKGLAIDLYTTADCDNIQGFQLESPISVDDSIFYDPDHFLFGGVEDWYIQRARHINYCYEFSMEHYKTFEQIQGVPWTVDTDAFFGNVTAQGPAVDSKNVVNATVNMTNESEFASSTVPLGLYVRPLGCRSTTTLQNLDCFYSGAAPMTTIFASFASFMLSTGLIVLVG